MLPANSRLFVLLLTALQIPCWLFLYPLGWLVSAPVLVVLSMRLPASYFFAEDNNESAAEPTRTSSHVISCVIAVIFIFVAGVAGAAWAMKSVGDEALGYAIMLLYSPLYALAMGCALGLHFSLRRASFHLRAMGYLGAIVGCPRLRACDCRVSGGAFGQSPKEGESDDR